MDLSKEVNVLIGKKYDEIRQCDKIFPAIEKTVREIRWKEPYLARHVRDRLIELAKENGDLP